MKLKVKKLDISSGGPIIAYLNLEDCDNLGLHRNSKIELRYKQKRIVADVDTTISTVPRNHIGLNKEALDSLAIKEKNVQIMLITLEKPKSIDYIKEKMDNKQLTREKVYHIVEDIVENKLGESEIAFFISATYMRGLSLKENIWLTQAMVDTGEKINLKRRVMADKHCIGGVAGNRTTMLIVPILAANRVTIAKTSSRSITSPAGTADTFEVLANVNLSKDKIIKTVRETNGCIAWGGSLNLAPADDKIIRVEHKISIDPESQLLASVLAKKKSVSSNYVLIDIPVGYGAKIESREDALRLKGKFEKIGKALKMKIKVIITDGSQPIGNGIGPALEARDVLYILMRDKRVPKDLEEKSLMMAGILFEMVGKAKKGDGVKLARYTLDSGKAYDKLKEIAQHQGARITNPERIKLTKHKIDVISKKSGTVKAISNRVISDIAKTAGNPLDKFAGIYLYKHNGSKVKKGDVLYTIYAEKKYKLNYSYEKAKLNNGYIIR
ncbi:MAG: AMP phosphorylase [Nitrospiraceae bacterium]|nr:AMP phosphorylase [Nitrospiraceae bacterium]